MGTATQVMVPLRKKLIPAHNNLFTTLTLLASAARLLDVTPRLQDNKATAKSVANARSALAMASQANIFTLGLVLLNQESCSRAGAMKAQDFLTAHKEKNPDLPNAFWTELEHMATGAMAGAVGKRQVVADVADDPPAKRIKVQKMAVAGSPSQTSTTAPSGSSDPDPTDRPCGSASAQADAGVAPAAAKPAARVALKRAIKRVS